MASVGTLAARAKARLEVARARFGVLDLAMSTFKRFSQDDGGSYAAALTFYIFFSLFPLLLFAVALLGFLTFGNEDLREDVLSAGLSAVPLLGQVLSPENLETIETRRREIALTGTAMALYSGTGAVVALSHALNRINGVEEERNFIGKRLRSLLWLGILGVAALVSLGLGALAGYAAKFFGPGWATAAGFVLGHVAGFGVGLLIFGSAFRFLPNKDLSWRDVLPGAAVAALLFEVLKEVGTWYLERGAATREATFGALAAAAGLLVASYLISQITLLSAELNDVLAERRLTRQAST